MHRLTSCAVAATLLLAACSSGDNDSGSSTSAPDPSTTASSKDTTTEPSTTSSAPPDYDFSAVSPVVAEFIETNELNGAALVVVDENDGVVYDDQWGDFEPGRISLVASSSKMIVAGVLLHLQDEGLIDIDAPVADIVDWGSANPSITPAQLMSNSSGLVGLLTNPAYPPYLCQFMPKGTLQKCAEQIFTTDADDADVVAPDTEFRYGGAQWQVAGALAEIASGKSWAELIDEIYTQPCELEVLAFNNHFTQLGAAGFDYPRRFRGNPDTLAATDNPNMEGGAYVNTSDYAKLLLMHLRDGRCGENQVLSTEALERLHGDRIGAEYDGDAYGEDVGYGMGWWVDRSADRIRDPGAYGSVPWLDLDDGYGAYLVIEESSVVGGALAEQLYDIVETAMAT